ncbi:MAG: collagen binding domain-containing protein [bacterium]
MCAIALGALAIVGCGDDPMRGVPDSTDGARLFGFVLQSDTMQPIADASVWLLAEDGVTFVDGPARTGASGLYAFDGLASGTYRVAATTPAGGCLIPFDGHDTPFAVSESDTVPATRDLLLRSRAFGCFAPPTIRAQVFDAATGAPIRGARIGQLRLNAPFNADADEFVLDTYTDESGEALYDALTSTVSGTDNQALSGLIVHHPDYATRIYPGEDSLIVITFTDEVPALVHIGLRAAAPNSGGTLRGVVTLGGAPAAGVPVGLAVVTDRVLSRPAPNDGKKSGVETGGAVAAAQLLSTTTDSTGAYAFAGIEPGRYFVRPGYLATDGFVSIDASAEGEHVVGRGAIVAAPELRVARTFETFEPADGLGALSDTVDFRWARVDGATRYVVQLQGGLTGRGERGAGTTDTTRAVAFFPPDEIYRWQVAAYDNAGRLLSLSEPPRFFTTGPPVSAR